MIAWLGMDSIIGSVGRVANVKVRNDDDLNDRVNHLYTTGILIIFTVVVSARQYVGDPIRCWCPAQFTGAHVDYTNNICWISNTYYIPMEYAVPESHAKRVENELTYYQWVPVMLLIQALMFYLPCIVWRLLNGHSGINVDRIVSLASDAQYEAPEVRMRTIKYVVRHIDRCLDNQRESRHRCCVTLRHILSAKLSLLCGRRYGNYLIATYLVMKVLYISNAIGQLFMLNAFLATEYNLYGFQVLDDLIKGSEWTASKRFPRVTMCDFSIRQMTNSHHYSVQCVLPINLFNEKIYIFLWFWLVFVSVLTSYSLMSWLWQMVFPSSRIHYVRKFLKIMDRIGSGPDKKLATRFTMEYLRHDGVFTLRLVGKNSSDIVVAEIVSGLWDVYRSKKSIQIRNTSTLPSNGHESDGEDV
ncbi:innexin unc-9-like isoform X2 [Physella acuta]|uniref:innexin unc-9-like isoform X2 n=2 Tax=Physella acuta TaxID=109671 RepID=UPI0027DD323D|nr:innexin unc-9-like isoform X2 [Physella acuta]